MKIEAAKRDLEQALQIATIGVSGSGDELASHYLFRIIGGAVEVLSANGQRIFTGSRLKCDHEGEDGDAFTVEGWRLRKWVDAMPDAVLTLNYEDALIRAKGPKTTVRWASLDPSKFPFWDSTLDKAKTIGSMSTAKLHQALSYSRQFVSDQENRHPNLAALEARDGSLFSTDQGAVSMVTFDEIKDSELRIHGKDAPAVLAFLSVKGSDTVEILEHERCLILRREDGGLLGVARWTYAFPNLSLDREEEDKCGWVVRTEDLRSGISTLSCSASKDDTRLFFQWDAENSQVVLSMLSTTGDRDVFPIDCIEHHNMDSFEAEEFSFSHTYIPAVTAGFEDDSLKFGINWTEKNGYIRFLHEKDDVSHLTVVVWLRD